ncbi:hypothetical protein FJTKL_11687 [Diaporthe vaccinii]|uniref:Uncharacterized protein n=1 Tax=Diaporthe vaccinii TaxID=105482 RepID=A0ABR4EFL2_9PEZI
MARRQSQRQASQKATARIKASLLKSKLPRGMPRAPEVHRTKRPAEATNTKSKATHTTTKATEAIMLISAIQRASDPIQCLNEWEDCEKRLLIENLLLSHRKLSGLPLADQALMGESDLLVGDEEELVTDDKDSLADTDEGSLDRIKMMHGQSCWPYPSISGNCSRPVTVDMDGCVDLQHDPYCLLKHFTTQWAVPMDQHRPVRGGTQFWSDWDWCFEAEGKHPGLRVDLSKFPRRGDTLFSDLISSQLLLYRIVTTFGAPPNTEEDGYKCAWSFTLLNKEDPTCALEIHDHKGWPQATFSGGERASTEALQLLDWLIGENCPHMYNYTLCGRPA